MPAPPSGGMQPGPWVYVTRTVTLAISLAAAWGGFLLFLQFGAADGMDAMDIVRAGLIFASTFWLAWGAVQATAAGVAIALGGIIRDTVSTLAASGSLGEALTAPSTGYTTVYHIEILLLFATLIAIGPLVGQERLSKPRASEKFGLAEFPG